MTDKASPPTDDLLLSAIRSILLKEVQSRMQHVEKKIAALHEHSNLSDQELQGHWAQLQAEFETMAKLARANDEFSRKAYAELQDLKLEALTDPEKITERLTPMMTNLIHRTIEESSDEMAEALGPVMSEAIRVQIRDSRQGMIDVLYPIIGETIQRAIAEFARELQQNIDARLRSAVRPQGFFRTFWARIRGVSPAELAFRDALPFRIREVFLIQHGSGMLMAHRSVESHQDVDSDLVSAMLTAIRDFGRDAISQGEELDEIQYGGDSIMLQTGKYVYLAAVVEGVEPEGFRAKLRSFITELHVRHSNALRDYNGDPDSLPDLQPRMTHLMTDLSEVDAGPATTRRQNIIVIGMGLFLLAAVSLTCFYLWFTVALWPLAFPGPTQTATQTATFTTIFTNTPLPTATHTPTHTATAMATSTASQSPSPTPTNTATALVPTATTIYQAFTKGNVWVRDEPSEGADRNRVIPNATPVTLLAVYGDWAWVEWERTGGLQRGWVPLSWLLLPVEIPANITTPTAVTP